MTTDSKRPPLGSPAPASPNSEPLAATPPPAKTQPKPAYIKSFLPQSLFKKRPSAQAAVTGEKNERLAEHFLQKRGLKLKERNYHCRSGEIDLIMNDGEVLVFVEVRFRKQAKYGSALESVDYRKQQKLIKAAQSYLLKHFPQRQPICRFDVVAIDGNQTPKPSQNPIEWLPNAFTA